MEKIEGFIPVITVDGPARAGKGEARRLAAQMLGWNELDSGAIYRALGYLADLYQTRDERILVRLALEMQIRFAGNEIWLNDVECSAILRSERCGQAASEVSKIPAVREALLDAQLNMRQLPGLVADGRDEGFVFPNSCRFYLVADPEERAWRAVRELQARHQPADHQVILQDILKRDRADETRAVRPLKPHPTALILDTTHMTPEAVVEYIIFHSADYRASYQAKASVAL